MLRAGLLLALVITCTACDRPGDVDAIDLASVSDAPAHHDASQLRFSGKPRPDLAESTHGITSDPKAPIVMWPLDD